MTDPAPFTPGITSPLGQIAYRVMAIAYRLYDLGLNDEACLLWGIADDLTDHRPEAS
jgi:hypothetical protein